jgi:hypothetical protein
VPHHRQPRGVDRGLILVERHDVRAGQAVQGEGLCGGIGGMLADGIGQVGRVRQGQRQAAAERRVGGADRVADRVQTGGAVSPGGADTRVKRRQPRLIDQHLRWTGVRPASAGAHVLLAFSGAVCAGITPSSWWLLLS